jgi:hypothetical protein
MRVNGATQVLGAATVHPMGDDFRDEFGRAVADDLRVELESGLCCRRISARCRRSFRERREHLRPMTPEIDQFKRLPIVVILSGTNQWICL